MKEKKIKNMNNKMATNTYLSTNESTKTNTENKQAEDKQMHRYREHFTVARWEGLWGMEEKGEGIKKNELIVTE